MAQQQSLDLDRISVAVQTRHSDVNVRDNVDTFGDPMEVGRQAARLSQRFFYAGASDSSAAKITTARCAGMLVYAMELYGFDFEGVLAASEFAVARIVAGISPDVRLPTGRRNEHQCSNVAQADDISQLVKLAEIVASTAHLMGSITAVDIAADPATYAEWTEGRIRILDVLHKIKGNAFLAATIHKVREDLVGLLRQAQAHDRPRRGRAGRQVAQAAMA